MSADDKDRRIADLEGQVAKLTAWKTSAMTELAGLDRLRPLATSRGARLGLRLADEVLRLWSEDVQARGALETATRGVIRFPSPRACRGKGR